MKKILILFAFSLLSLQFTFAQTVTLSNPIESNESGNPDEFLCRQNGKLYYFSPFLRGTIRSYAEAKGMADEFFFQILIYDEQKNEKAKIYEYKRKDFKALSKEQDILFENVVFFNDSLTILYTNIPKNVDNLKLYAVRVPLQDPEKLEFGRNTLVTEIKIDNPNDKSKILINKSRDGSKFMFYQSPDVSKNQFIIINYGYMKSDVTDIKIGSFTTDIIEKESRGVLQYFISQNGNAYFVLNKYKDKIQRPIGYIYSLKQNELKTFSFTTDSEAEIISSISCAELKDNKILIAEYRFNFEKGKKDNPDGILKAGIYGRIIDDITFKETQIEPVLFEKDNFKDFDLKWFGDKNSDIKPIFLKSVILMEPIVDNDHVYLTGSNFYTTATSDGSGGSYSIGHWNGILAVKFNLNKNKFEYLTTIPMIQKKRGVSTFSDYYTAYNKYAFFHTNDKLYIILNDNEKNIKIKENAKLLEYPMNSTIYKFVSIDNEGNKSSKYLEANSFKKTNPDMKLQTATLINNQIVVLGNYDEKFHALVTFSLDE